VKKLGWEEIAVTVSTANAAAVELEENEQRKNFTNAEKLVAIQNTLPTARKEAAKRKAAGQKEGGHIRQGSASLPDGKEAQKKKSTNLAAAAVAEATGLSQREIARIARAQQEESRSVPPGTHLAKPRSEEADYESGSGPPGPHPTARKEAAKRQAAGQNLGRQNRHDSGSVPGGTQPQKGPTARRCRRRDIRNARCHTFNPFKCMFVPFRSRITLQSCHRPRDRASRLRECLSVGT